MEASGSSLFLNLMLADLPVQTIGSMPSIRWMREGTVTAGSLCTAQAVIKQIGINGVALSSLCIALHTFGVLVLQWRVPRHDSKLAVVFVWVFIALVLGIPNAVHRKEVYYGPPVTGSGSTRNTPLLGSSPSTCGFGRRASLWPSCMA
ncbi:hypothetical protein DFP72DRAFT_906698 [Ephemerocybe angulata]|uniref:Uncharacterized protein n=1 Tax=Ephemerocybe angulata TaxID=980116 RepID=A0A8H6M244_9AGAR|nr:hypothetical protein DFP72DRAFT_906698 [Tulosesus angulatus]